MNNYFAVLEYLPWLKTPRIIEYFEDLRKAEAEAQRLNSKSLDSNFSVASVKLVFESGLVSDSENINATKLTNTSLRF
jgi:hypothetical protein